MKLFRLVHQEARTRCAQFIAKEAPDGWEVIAKPPTRNLEQNAKFHAICSDLAKAGMPWQGKPRTTDQWKVLLVSGHAVATKQGADMVPGLEGEYVNLRESTALMSKARSSSLIEYAVAFCAMHEIEITEGATA